MAPKARDGDVVAAVGSPLQRIDLIIDGSQFSGAWISWAHTIVAYC